MSKNKEYQCLKGIKVISFEGKSRVPIEIYSDVFEAAEKAKFTVKYIYNCCIRRYNFGRGILWRFLDDCADYNDRVLTCPRTGSPKFEIFPPLISEKSIHKNIIEINSYNMNIAEYKDIFVAEDETGISAIEILKSCVTMRPTTDGSRFVQGSVFAQLIKISPDPVSEIDVKGNPLAHFETIEKAEERTGICKKMILLSIQKNKPIRGRKFRRITQRDAEALFPKKGRVKRKVPLIKPV